MVCPSCGAEPNETEPGVFRCRCGINVDNRAVTRAVQVFLKKNE